MGLHNYFQGLPETLELNRKVEHHLAATAKVGESRRLETEDWEDAQFEYRVLRLSDSLPPKGDETWESLAEFYQMDVNRLKEGYAAVSAFLEKGGELWVGVA